jgi:hypothetical protein
VTGTHTATVTDTLLASTNRFGEDNSSQPWWHSAIPRGHLKTTEGSVFKKKKKLPARCWELIPVNPSHSGGRDQEDGGSRPA